MIELIFASRQHDQLHLVIFVFKGRPTPGGGGLCHGCYGRDGCPSLMAGRQTCKWVSSGSDGITLWPTIPSQISWRLGGAVATRSNLCNRIASSLFMWHPSSCNDRYA